MLFLMNLYKFTFIVWVELSMLQQELRYGSCKIWKLWILWLEYLKFWASSIIHYNALERIKIYGVELQMIFSSKRNTYVCFRWMFNFKVVSKFFHDKAMKRIIRKFWKWEQEHWTQQEALRYCSSIYLVKVCFLFVDVEKTFVSTDVSKANNTGNSKFFNSQESFMAEFILDYFLIYYAGSFQPTIYFP